MDQSNPLYKNQGIHTNIVLLTADSGELKVLLVKRLNNPFLGKWALPGGAVYNNETIDDAILRELKEKTSIDNIQPKMFNVFSKVNRAPQMRMICVAYLAVIDKSAISFTKQTTKTDDADWVKMEDIPHDLAYDHNEIVESALDYLKTEVWKSGILKKLFPQGVTMSELHQVYCKILGVNLDRRNFRKKLLVGGFVSDSGNVKQEKGKKPAIIYTIN